MNEFERIFWKAIRISRSDVFSPDHDQMPKSEPSDALIPQIGFIGRNYVRGGDVLLGINPGGGGDTYVRTTEDAWLLPRIHQLRSQDFDEAMVRQVFDSCAANMRTWNLWRIVSPVLDACGRDQSEIAYFNWCPFRTRSDKMPRAATMRLSNQMYLHPLLSELAPGRVIALGKKVGGWLKKTNSIDAEIFEVPRTIGDSYVSDEAFRILDEIRRSKQ